MVIWKYQVREGVSRRDQVAYTFDIPSGAQILCVQMQDDMPTIWAMVNPADRKVRRRFVLVDTGDEFDANGLVYIGTVQDSRGYVTHVFEKVR